MRIITLLFLGYILTYSHVTAQEALEIKLDRDNENNITFSCTNNDFCTYTLEIEFTKLVNLKATEALPYKGNVKMGSNMLFKLSVADETSPIDFDYTYSYSKGCVQPDIKQNFTYLLPIASGKKTVLSEIKCLNTMIAKENPPKDWYVIGLSMKPGDTIFASRRGYVCFISSNNGNKGKGLVYASDENTLEIAHSDCSFGEYEIFKKDSYFVKVGQFVDAGEPLGLVGGENYYQGTHMRFSVYYNHEEPVIVKGKKTSQKNYVAYVPLKFHTKEVLNDSLKYGVEYTSDQPVSVITQEMTKREIKKWSSSKK